MNVPTTRHCLIEDHAPSLKHAKARLKIFSTCCQVVAALYFFYNLLSLRSGDKIFLFTVTPPGDTYVKPKLRTIHVTNSPGSPGTFPVLALKVPHPRNPLSPGQTGMLCHPLPKGTDPRFLNSKPRHSSSTNRNLLFENSAWGGGSAKATAHGRRGAPRGAWPAVPQSERSPSLGSPGLQPLAARSMAFTQRPFSSSVSALKM